MKQFALLPQTYYACPYSIISIARLYDISSYTRPRVAVHQRPAGAPAVFAWLEPEFLASFYS